MRATRAQQAAAPPAAGAQLHASECAVEEWLAFLGHRWNALILWHLSQQPKRFGVLAECLPGITPKVLTERLDNLESRALVVKSPLATYPRGVSYALSKRGEEIMVILDAIELWSRTSGDEAASSP